MAWPRMVMVVDDEPAVLDLISDLLREEGYHAVSFDHPRRALAEAKAHAPSLFILDVMLPTISGIDLAASLRSDGFAETPIIAISASYLATSLANDSGLFTAVLAKPFDVVDLLDLVHDVMQPGGTGGSE